MTDHTLTILGATGYTGRLCVAEALRQGMPVRLAGRRRDALDALAAEHAGVGVPIEVSVADVDDQSSLRNLAAASDVLLTTVGPYAKLGRGVVDAVIEAGVPYLDVTGELEFLTWAYAQQERAVAANVTLAPGVGFDGVPGDLLAALAARALPGPAAQVRVAYHMSGAKVSAGTARSGLGALAKGGAAWRDNRVAQEPAGADSWLAPFPSPPGPARALSGPLPEVVTVGRSVGTPAARAYMVVPAAKTLASMAGPAQRVASLLSATPVWGLLEKGVNRLPEGPSGDDRAKMRAVVVAEAITGDGSSAVRWGRVTDMYGTTAKIAVAAARRLLDGDVGPGVVTPSQLFDPEALWEQIGAELGPA